MKILIIHAVSSEKSLLVTPPLRALKAELDAEIHLIDLASNKDLLDNNPYLDEWIDCSSGFFRLRNRIRGEKYDLIVDLQNTSGSRLLRFGLGTKKLVFPSEAFSRQLYIKTKINRLSKKHLSDQYLDLLEPLGVKGDSLGIDFFVPEKDEVENDWLPKTHQNGYAALAIGASHQTKKLPINRLIELCDRINKPIALIGESTDLAIANEVESFFKPGTPAKEEEIEGLNKKAIIFNACGKFNFNQSCSLIKNASWVFSYDNVMMQIAAAFKKRVYSIWGSSTPLFRTYPYRTEFTIFENNKLGCRPCSSTGYQNCPKGHFKCMNDVGFDFYLPD